MAKNINYWLGGAFVAAWDVPYLDEATTDLFLALHAKAAQTPNLTQNVQAVEAFKRNYRRNFYRKH